MEIVPTADTDGFSRTVFFGDKSKTKSDSVYLHYGTIAGWHTYAFEYTPSTLKWIVDGVERSSVNIGPGAYNLKDSTFPILFNFWSATYASWGDGFNDIIFPIYSKYDYFRFYKFDASTNKFAGSPSFSDEFNGKSLDLSKWRTSNS